MNRSIDTMILSDNSQHKILRLRIKHNPGRLGGTGAGRVTAKNDGTTVCVLISKKKLISCRYNS